MIDFGSCLGVLDDFGVSENKATENTTPRNQ